MKSQRGRCTSSRFLNEYIGSWCLGPTLKKPSHIVDLKRILHQLVTRRNSVDMYERNDNRINMDKPSTNCCRISSVRPAVLLRPRGSTRAAPDLAACPASRSRAHDACSAPATRRPDFGPGCSWAGEVIVLLQLALHSYNWFIIIYN